MYKHINARQLGRQQKFLVDGDRNWYTTTNEPFVWEGKTYVPCTCTLSGMNIKPKNRLRSKQFIFKPEARVRVWHD